MTILVTGSAGHLGEALMRVLRAQGRAAIGIDRVASPFTDRVGSIVERDFVDGCMDGVEAIVHAATLHKPHVATHARQDFVDTNITGTLNLLEAAATRRVRAFVFTSTTSVFGDALRPPDDAPAAWITEQVAPKARNIYGASKAAAEDLCRLFHRNQGLPCLVLRTSRFFPEPDDDAALRGAWDDANIKANELLYRRADIADVVDAHLLALERAPALGFGRYIVSATTPFQPGDAAQLRRDAPVVLAQRVPEYVDEYARRGWRMFPGIDVSTTTPWHAGIWVGARATTSPIRYGGCAAATTRAARWRARSASRATTASTGATGCIRSASDTALGQCGRSGFSRDRPVDTYRG